MSGMATAVAMALPCPGPCHAHGHGMTIAMIQQLPKAGPLWWQAVVFLNHSVEGRIGLLHGDITAKLSAFAATT